MAEITRPNQQMSKQATVETVADLRAVGLLPREIQRLRNMRDCLRCYPQIEFFANDQWRRLLFMKWRYDRGDYIDDRPPNTVVVIKDDFES